MLELSTEKRFSNCKLIRPQEDTPASARWYAVHTLPRRELGACAQLEAQSFKTFLPRHLKTVRHARKLKTIDAPFFPRYFFVSLDLSRDRWRSINGTFGVSSLIMSYDRPMPVPDGIVEVLQARLQSGATATNDLQIGEQVEVLVGPFANLVGQLERFDGNERVRILLEIMGSATSVSLARNAVIRR